MAWVLFLILAIVFQGSTLSQARHVYFDLDLTWGKGSPNGLEREMIFVNKMFPGPPLILDEGDLVTVKSSIFYRQANINH